MKITRYLRSRSCLRLLAACWAVSLLTGSLSQAAPALEAAKLRNVSPLPTIWGSPVRALKPVPPSANKAVKRTGANQLLPLPPPDRLARMPVARIQIGTGQVDPVCATTGAGGAYLYVVKAGAPGVVEYLYPREGAFQAGEALVRLYDLTILADLHIGESAMARFASSPFVIAPADSTLPPLPPGVSFPQPTADSRALGIRLAAPAASLDLQPTLSGLQPVQSHHNTGLSRAPGLATESRPPQALKPINPPAALPLPEISGLSEQLADHHQRLQQLADLLAQIDKRITATRARIEQAKTDATASERLFNQGVLARNVHEGAQAHLQAAENDLQELLDKRAETLTARETLQGKSRQVQGRIDAAVADRARRAEEANRVSDTLRTSNEMDISPSINSSRLEAPQTSIPNRGQRAALTDSSRQDSFPSPTQTRRPEVANLPRVPASSRLRPTIEVPSVPEEVKRLSAPRWRDETAPSDGVVIRQLVPDGAQVKAGTPLLEVANREWARIYADISRDQMSSFPKGAPVQLTFDEYPEVIAEGWINAVTPVAHTNLAQVEMVVLCREGYYPGDTYASLQWMTLAAPLVEDDIRETLTPGVEVTPSSKTDQGTVYNLLPLVPPQVGPGQKPVVQVKEREYVGLVRLGETDQLNAHKLKQQPAQSKRLAALKKWRDSFIAGMATTLFGDLVLTYPREGEIARAVERMATAQVTHVDNRCARTLREALGWGLGDAAMWMKRLPEKGYLPRKDGLARPGDILVWPFTYGARRSQHIGIAVSQGGRLMLLSNLSGTLGTTELLGGYIAFYHPDANSKAKLKP